MFGTCELCESNEIEVMFVRGSEVCYACAVLTEDTEDTDTEGEEL